MTVVTLPPPRPKRRRCAAPQALANAALAAEVAAQAIRNLEHACAIAGLPVCAALPARMLDLAGQFDVLAAEIYLHGEPNEPATH